MDGASNLKLKLSTINVRGIRNCKKRKTIFNWIDKNKFSITFLQETFITNDIENSIVNDTINIGNVNAMLF